MDFLVFILIVFLGFTVVSFHKNRITKKQLKLLYSLWLYHLIFGIYYCFFIEGDAKGYWLNAKLLTWEGFVNNFSVAKGTAFMYVLNYIPASVLNLSYFLNTMLFTLIGFMGLVYFYIVTLKLVPFNSKIGRFKLFPFLFFLPNLHFWSVAIGKDTILFFCLGAISYGAYYKKYPLLIFSLLLVFGVRPHMLLFIILAFGFVNFINKKVTLFAKLFISALMIGTIVLLIPSVEKSGKIEVMSLKAETFYKFSKNKAAVLSRSHTDSRVDISKYSFPQKIFTFLYRPFFFDINGIPAILASFENLLLLILTLKVIKRNPIKAYSKAPNIIKWLLVLLFIGTFVFSQSLGNLGIMLRMRNMFLPGMIIFILWVLSLDKESKIIKARQSFEV